MGISNQIEVFTIATEEAKILKINVMIPLQFQSSLTGKSRNNGKETCQNICFLFRVFDCLFSPFCCRFGCAELNGSITMRGNSEDFA